MAKANSKYIKCLIVKKTKVKETFYHQIRITELIRDGKLVIFTEKRVD